MNLIQPDPPVITIARDNVPYPHYAVWLTLDGVKECRFWSSDYYTAVAFAQGIASGIESVGDQRPVEAFEISQELFDSQQIAPRGDSPFVPLVTPAGSIATPRQGGSFATIHRSQDDPAHPDAGAVVERSSEWAAAGRGDVVTRVPRRNAPGLSPSVRGR